MVRDEDRGRPAGFHGGHEPLRSGAPERELAAEPDVPRREAEPAAESRRAPRSRGLLLGGELAGIEEEVDPPREVREPLVVDRRAAGGDHVAVHRIRGVRRLREPEPDRSVVAAEEGRVEVDHRLEQDLPLDPVVVREDRVERRGHHEARGPPPPCSDRPMIRVRVPLEEPREGLGLDVHGRDPGGPLEDRLEAAVRPEHGVRPVLPADPLGPDRHRDRRMALLESRRLQRVRREPPHDVPGLVAMEMERQRRQGLTPTTRRGRSRGTGSPALRPPARTPRPPEGVPPRSPCGRPRRAGRTSRGGASPGTPRSPGRRPS